MSQDPTRPETLPLGPSTRLKKGLAADYVSVIRAKLRDYPELNRLVSGVEHSDVQIAMALAEAIDDWNTTPPLLDAVDLAGFPSTSLLINGAIVHLLHSAGFLQMRNHMQYSDGQGISVSTSDKAPQYLSWANLFAQSYEAKKNRLKMAQNLIGAMRGAGLHSEYANVNGWFEIVDETAD